MDMLPSWMHCNDSVNSVKLFICTCKYHVLVSETGYSTSEKPENAVEILQWNRKTILYTHTNAA